MRKLVEDPVMVGVLTPETTADGAPATLGARGEPCKGLPPPDREALLWWKWCRTFDWVPPITALGEAGTVVVVVMEGCGDICGDEVTAEREELLAAADPEGEVRADDKRGELQSIRYVH